MVPPFLAYSMLTKCVSPRRDAPFPNICCFIEGKHHFSTQAFCLAHIHVFKCMRCFAMAKQHFQHAHVNQKGSMGNQKPYVKPRKPRFQNQCVAKTIETTNMKSRCQNQWVAKTIEKTNKNKTTKISEPMGNENHRENQQTQKTNTRFQDQ